MSFILIEIFCYGSIQTLFLKLTPWAPPEFVRIQTGVRRRGGQHWRLSYAALRATKRNNRARISTQLCGTFGLELAAGSKPRVGELSNLEQTRIKRSR